MEGTVPARRVALVGIVALSLWAAVAAPKLDRAVRAAPLGPWRDVQLALLAPFRPASTAPMPVAATPTEAWTPATVHDVPPAGAATLTRRRPTPEAPARILVVGDSLGKDFAYGLEQVLAGDPRFVVAVDARPATGLARPDYFDWPARLRADLERERPEIVVVMLGGDDAQPFELEGRALPLGSAEWRAAYGARVAAFMRAAAAEDRAVLWIGLPVMRDAEFSERMAELNAIYRTAAEHERVTYVDVWALFADAAGRYAAYLPDARGRPTLLRQSDGIHFNVDGAIRIGRFTEDAIERLFPAE